MTQQEHDQLVMETHRAIANAMEARMKQEKALSSANEKAAKQNILVSSITETE